MAVDCDVFVFDFDGVLARGGAPRPLGVGMLKAALELGVVYVYSGRPREDLGVVLEVLEEAGVARGSLAGILLRAGSAGELEAKRGHLEIILRREGCVGEVHDDNEEALWLAWEVAAPRALVLHGDDWCRALRGRSLLEGYCRG
ncbi:hypothetical protein [Stetteria hydrogenophila]